MGGWSQASLWAAVVASGLYHGANPAMGWPLALANGLMEKNARIPPSRLALWSFAVAIAHGAGLMLIPIYLGLCRPFDADRGHEAARALIEANLGMALIVSAVHATAMIGVGGLLAWLVYRYLGLKFLSRGWFNLDAIWASSLILVGTLALALNAAD